MTALLDKKEQQKLAERLVKKTHFNKFEIESLLRKYRELTKKKQKMDRILFCEILCNHFGMTDSIMMDNIFRIFDRDNDSIISMEEWIRGLSVFLRGNLQEQIKFCFDVYDLNGDGYISRDEMYQLLKDCLKYKYTPDEDPEDTKRELVDYALKQLDMDSDSRVSFTDFETAVNGKELLLECLGPCIPDYRVKSVVNDTFFREEGDEEKIMKFK